jgi:hypothetical protein
MTETSILAPSTDSGIDMVPPGTGVDESEGGDRRRLMIIGGIAGLLIVIVAAYLLLHKGSSSTDDSFVPQSTHPATSTQSNPTTGAAKATDNGSSKAGGSHATAPTTLPKKAHRPQVRDPFKPLVTAPVTDGGGATTTTTVDATNPTGTTTDGTTPTGVTLPPAPTTTTTGHGTVSGSPLWVQLMKVNGDRATFRVGYAHHKYSTFNVQAPKATSQQGTVFDQVFALVGIQGGQVTIQIGDDTPFDLTKGISHAV